MTKYVLNSGNLFNVGDKGRAYVAEIVKGLGDNPKILICLFASPRETWTQDFKKYTEKFRAVLPEGVNPEFELALPADFARQMEHTDAVYIHGGEIYLLVYWMLQFDLSRLFKDKVVATSSVATELMTRTSWSVDWRECMDHLWLVPIKFIAHYQSDLGADDLRGPIDWQKAYDELAAYGDTSLPIQALKDGEFVVIERNTGAALDS